MSKILLAGSTGYLGNFILHELLRKDFATRVIVRDKKKLPLATVNNDKLEIRQAEITNPRAIENCCRDIDTVISTVGITKQKDGLTYLAVDYQANMNLLEDALRNGVRKFIYVSVLNGDKLTQLKICEAKEKFVDALKKSGLDYCIIRPTGYFSDMGEFFSMAQKGKVFVLGGGETKMNPIHGADLATVCVDAINKTDKEVLVGGPEVFTYNQIARIALNSAGKKERILHIPDAIPKVMLFLLRTFFNSKFYGPIEFF